MRLVPTEVPGPVVVVLEEHRDERGFFARTFDSEEFAAAGLEPVVLQTNFSHNGRAGTLRGMHLQVAPAPESKLVRCVRGAVLDVVVDLRPGSSTRLQHVAVELSAANRLALYVPPLFAHGFLTLADDTDVTYQVSARHTPAAERGLRYDDPALGIDWGAHPVRVISAKDSSWPLLTDDAELP